ncbi:hypothetical protein ABJI51_03410 [Amycolatopsis sp. NEAU-NG30]|uniref:Uncharacterized protein n=1 Tax=Amycolatopsis melonis TaxID=3156488 RepID=A0ABV0L769_9PSEU
MTEVQSAGPSAARTWAARTVGAGLIAATAAIGGAAAADAAVLPDPVAQVVTHGKNAAAATAACTAKTHGQAPVVFYLLHIPFTDLYLWSCHPNPR